MNERIQRLLPWAIRYILLIAVVIGLLTWLSFQVTYNLRDAKAHREYVLWHGAVYLIEDIYRSPEIDGRFELRSSFQVTRMTEPHIPVWVLGVLLIVIPGAILSLVAAMRHWWRVAERGLKQKGIAIWLVAGALLMFSGFFYANVLKLLYIYHGCIGIGQSPFASWFETALIGESSNEFHWLPFVEFRVLYLPVWLIALVLWLINYAIAVRRKPPSGPLCIECGYNLKGNISGRCPECGTLIASETPT